MLNRLRRKLALVCFGSTLICILGTGGCTPGSSTPASQPVAVAVAPTSAQIARGQQWQFSASVSNDPRNQGVTWSLSGTGCTGNTCGTLSSTSANPVTYSAPASIPNPATITIKATSVADSSQSSSATITVTPPSISVAVAPVNPSVQAEIGRQAFTATVNNDPQSQGVIWTLSGAACSGSSCGTISNQTLTTVSYAAPPTAPNAAVTLTATSVTDNSKSGTATITVTPPVSLGVTPPNPSVSVNLQQTFTATIGNDFNNQGITWSLSGAGCSGANCGTLSAASGSIVIYTAPPNVPSPATVSLVATSVADPLQSVTETITVLAPISVSVATTVSDPIIPRTNYPLKVSQSQSFTATLQNDANNSGVTWSISGGTCAGTTCGTLSGTNLNPVIYTAPASISNLTTQNPLTFTLTATSVADPTKSASATIPVSQGLPTTIGWFEVPNTQIYPICPNITEIQGAIGCAGAIRAWNGGIADTTRNRLVFTGGGHENYWGNEVYALDIASLSLGSGPITNPTVPVGGIPPCQEDWGSPPAIPSAPSARENYGTLAYVAHLDKMFLFGGALAYSGCRSSGLWLLDLPSLAWTEKDPTNGTQETLYTDINYADYDPASKLVYIYIANNDVLASYSADTNTMTQLASGQAHGVAHIHSYGVLDPKRHIFLMMGAGYAAWFDLNVSPPQLVDVSLQVGGGTCGTTTDPNYPSIQDAPSPGLAYDPVQDKIVGWPGGNTAYIIDTSQTTSTTPTLTCSTVTFSGGPPASQPNGTFGRFRYFPGLNIFALVNDWQQNAFILRMTPPGP